MHLIEWIWRQSIASQLASSYLFLRLQVFIISVPLFKSLSPLYVYIFGIHNWRPFRNRSKKFEWVVFESRIIDLPLDTLSNSSYQTMSLTCTHSQLYTTTPISSICPVFRFYFNLSYYINTNMHHLRRKASLKKLLHNRKFPSF